jgi:hypothetical protein
VEAQRHPYNKTIAFLQRDGAVPRLLKDWRRVSFTGPFALYPKNCQA